MDEQERATIRVRVIIVLKYWVEHHFSDFDEVRDTSPRPSARCERRLPPLR